MVDVGVSADGEYRSRACVKYRMTSLSSDADDFVREFGEAFEYFMGEWADTIQRHIVEGVHLAGWSNATAASKAGQRAQTRLPASVEPVPMVAKLQAGVDGRQHVLVR